MSSDPDYAIVARLRAAGCVFAEDEAALLIAEARSPGELESLVARRVEGMPLEHLLGWAEFRGLRIAVEPGVFVPRRRTSYLVKRAAALARPGAVVVDLCCGTGAVGAALIARRGDLDLYAADVDPAAVRSARRNLPADRVFEGDLFGALPTALRGGVDILVANAPYVPTEAIRTMPPEARIHEAGIALDGGPDGLDVQRRVAGEALQWLVPGGHLLMETSVSQSATSAAIVTAAGFVAEIRHSDRWDATVVIGRAIRP